MRGSGSKGTWVLTEIDAQGIETYTCSECKKHRAKIDPISLDLNSLADFPYCHCGAKMKNEPERALTRKRKEATRINPPNGHWEIIE